MKNIEIHDKICGYDIGILSYFYPNLYYIISLFYLYHQNYPQHFGSGVCITKLNHVDHPSQSAVVYDLTTSC